MENTSTPCIKWLSMTKMVEHRAKSFCYNCGEPYSVNHQCKKLFWVELEDSSNTSYYQRRWLGISFFSRNGVMLWIYIILLFNRFWSKWLQQIRDQYLILMLSLLSLVWFLIVIFSWIVKFSILKFNRREFFEFKFWCNLNVAFTI